MPTELGPRFETFDPIDPPQMLPQDWPIWQKFRKAYGDLFLHFFYSVKLGGQLLTDPAIPENMKKTWYASTAKRVDAIGETKEEVWIIEVASNPGLRAIGQVLTYASLWGVDPKINKPAVSVLVSERVDQDLRFACMVQGVRVMEIPWG
jgi:hypothetical protein